MYTGQIIDGLPDGYGKAMSFQNGQFHAAYEGLWKKGMPNPFGGLKTSYDSAYNGSYYYGATIYKFSWNVTFYKVACLFFQVFGKTEPFLEMTENIGTPKARALKVTIYDSFFREKNTCTEYN